MAITIKDIAKAAGVSHTTVSRALKGNPAISSETTERIQQLALEMGYTPSAVAQSLLSRRTLTIGMVVTTISDLFITQVVEGVEKVAREANYSVFLATSHNEPEQEMAIVETFHRRRVDAIIVTSSRVGSLYSSELNQIQIPIVLINNQEEGEYLYSVAVDDIKGAQVAVEHLISLGHRSIGYIGSASRPKSNRRRLTGYQRALLQNDIMLDDRLIFSSENVADVEKGELTIEAVLAANATAVFCYNDMIAIGLINSCRQRDISVPEELSVVGFDDIEAAGFVSPPLTTIHQPRGTLGKLAMTMALKLLDNQVVSNERLRCELVIRESTTSLHRRKILKNEDY